MHTSELFERTKELIRTKILPDTPGMRKPVWELILSKPRGTNALAREICAAFGQISPTYLAMFQGERGGRTEFFKNWCRFEQDMNSELAKLQSEGIDARIGWAMNSEDHGWTRHLVLTTRYTGINKELTPYTWAPPSGIPRNVHANVPIQTRSVLEELRVHYLPSPDRWAPPTEVDGVTKDAWKAHVQARWQFHCEELLGAKGLPPKFAALQQLIERPAICAVLSYRHRTPNGIEFLFVRTSFKNWIATTGSLEEKFDASRKTRDVLTKATALPVISEGWSYHFIPAVNALHVLVHVVSRDGFLIARQGTQPNKRWQAAIQGFVDPILDTNRIDPYLPDHREAAFRVGRELLGQAISLTQIRWFGVCMAYVSNGNVFILGSVTLDQDAEAIMDTARRRNSSRQRACEFDKILFDKPSFYEFVRANEVSVAFEVAGSLALNRRAALQQDLRSGSGDNSGLTMPPVVPRTPKVTKAVK